VMIQSNKTKRKLRAGELVFGVMITIPGPRVVELCGLAGFDYVVIDAEHAPIDVAMAEDMVRAAELVNVTPLVRVPSHDPRVILRYLDSGAQGVMVPQVNSATEAARIVSAVKYAPLGTRGLGSGRAAAYGQEISQPEYAKHANNETMIIAQLEHIDALAELPGILKVDGIDAFEIGLADISQSLGLAGEKLNPKVLSVARQFATAVISAGRIIGDTANDPQSARALVAEGYRMIDCGMAAVTSRALRDHLQSIRD
jgi:4-hydroxy-2-oxoheptanedioate aldolase